MYLYLFLAIFTCYLYNTDLLSANYVPDTLLDPGMSKNRHDSSPHLTAGQVGMRDVNRMISKPNKAV